MNSNVRPTSRSSYYDHVVSGKSKSQRVRIMESMLLHRFPRNRREISLMTGIPINAVCGRVNALIENGDLQIARINIDPSTGRRVEYLAIPYKVIQARLF